MCVRYTLGWLDSLITISINPAKTFEDSISDEEIRCITSKLNDEREKLLTGLKSELLGLSNNGDVAFYVNQSHSWLIILLDQVSEYRTLKKLATNSHQSLYNELTKTLGELLYFMESRFFKYLSLDERASATYLSDEKTEFKLRVDQLKIKLLSQKQDNKIVNIILDNFNYFLDRIKGEFFISFRELLYQKDLLTELEVYEYSEIETREFPSLSDLLIYLNFNNKAYIDYLIGKYSENISAYDSMSDKLDGLLFHYKEFNQMHLRPDIALNPKYGSLKAEVSNWFLQEISYWEKKLHLNIPSQNRDVKQNLPKTDTEKNCSRKLLCNLSVDQMALIFRSADDLQIVTARSLNSVFKTIVPYLSTRHLENISYDSMRSKSYSAETRDKEIVIATLDTMINKIRDY